MPTNGPSLARYIGIDYSGASTSTSSRSGLRIYLAEDNTTPVEVMPPPSPHEYWTQLGIARRRLRQMGCRIGTKPN